MTFVPFEADAEAFSIRPQLKTHYFLFTSLNFFRLYVLASTVPLKMKFCLKLKICHFSSRFPVCFWSQQPQRLLPRFFSTKTDHEVCADLSAKFICRQKSELYLFLVFRIYLTYAYCELIKLGRKLFTKIFFCTSCVCLTDTLEKREGACSSFVLRKSFFSLSSNIMTLYVVDKANDWCHAWHKM